MAAAGRKKGEGMDDDSVEERRNNGEGVKKSLPPPSRGLIAGYGQREGDFQIVGTSGIQQGWQRRIGGWLGKGIKMNTNSKKNQKIKHL
jgi:hypothetical protein